MHEWDICETERGKYTYSENGDYFVWLTSPTALYGGSYDEQRKGYLQLVLSNVPRYPRKEEIVQLENGKDRKELEAEMWADSIMLKLWNNPLLKEKLKARLNGE